MMRSLLISTAILLTATLDLHCAPIQRSAPTPQHPMGINLAAVSFWTPEIVFVDVFKQSHPWTSQLPGKEWNRGGPLSINNRGWVENLNGNGHFAESLIFVDLQAHYPAGDYICLFDGKGEIEFGQAAKIAERKPGRLVVQVSPKEGAIAVRITRTDAGDPIRNLRLILPGFEKTYRDQPFHPDFLKRWQGFQVIRFMDWGMTNNSKIQKWSDRTQPDQASQALDSGVALEYQIDLANRLAADPWFCIPHRADDDYVRSFATLVKTKLDPNRKVYLEFSNECWHPGFEGGRYCAEQGKSLGLSKNNYEASLRYYSQRSIEIFNSVESDLGKERLVRILNTPPDSEWAIGTVLDWKNASKHVDAVAIAPYFGGPLGNPQNAEKTQRMNVEQLLAMCKTEIETNGKRTQGIAKLVKDRGLQLLAYEGGQHLVGVEDQEKNEKLMALFMAANRSPRIRELYLDDFKGWSDAGGGLFCVFSSMTRYGRHGSWGVLEYADQDEKTAPKLQAIREWMKH